jgi:hypothetical protein
LLHREPPMYRQRLRTLAFTGWHREAEPAVVGPRVPLRSQMPGLAVCITHGDQDVGVIRRIDAVEPHQDRCGRNGPSRMPVQQPHKSMGPLLVINLND